LCDKLTQEEFYKKFSYKMTSPPWQRMSYDIVKRKIDLASVDRTSIKIGLTKGVAKGRVEGECNVALKIAIS